MSRRRDQFHRHVHDAIFVFQVPLKGSFLVLLAGTLVYVFTTTGYGMLISTVCRSQIAALFGRTLTDPVGSSLVMVPSLVAGALGLAPQKLLVRPGIHLDGDERRRDSTVVTE